MLQFRLRLQIALLMLALALGLVLAWWLARGLPVTLPEPAKPAVAAVTAVTTGRLPLRILCAVPPARHQPL